MHDWVTLDFFLFCAISFNFLCFLRSAAYVTSGAEHWRKPKMTSENRLFFITIMSAHSPLTSSADLVFFAILNHPVMLTWRVCVWTDGLTSCAQWRCQRSGSATRPRGAPSTPVGSPCSATNWWVGTHAHVPRHTCAHTDVVLEFPRSSRAGSL